MQNPDMKKKVEDFLHNLSHSIKKTSEDIQDQAKKSANDVAKEMSDSVKDIHK